MKYLEFQLTNLITKYAYDEISESEFYNQLEFLSLNEDVTASLKDYISQAKSVGENAIVSLCVNVYVKLLPLFKDASKFVGKISKVIMWLLKKIESFKQKHPILYKVLQITLIIVAILLLSVVSVHAADNPHAKVDIQKDFGIDKTHLNTLIGYVHDYDSKVGDLRQTKVEAMLIDIKDGVIDGPWNKEDILKAINIENKVLHDSLIGMTKQGIDKSSLGDLLDQMQKAGEQLIGFTYKHIQGDGFDQEKVDILKKATGN